MKSVARYMIRMDDITPDMDWDKFNRIRTVFEENNIHPLLGVVPDNRDPKLMIQEKAEDFWSIIRELRDKGWVISQHGTFHQYVTEDSGILGLKNASEFAGLSYQEQVKKIIEGKSILEQNGINTRIFMAPGHTFDDNTVKALKELGFDTVTDGLYYRPYTYKDILFVPCRLQGYRNIKGIDTVCLHANNMSDSDIENLEMFCKNNSDKIYPFLSEEIRASAVKYSIFVRFVEHIEVYKRWVKNRISNSDRMKWYMQYTDDPKKIKKHVKRVICLPLLFAGSRRRNESD